MKTCTVCLEEKKLEEFSNKVNRCKECTSEYKRQYYLNNKDKYKIWDITNKSKQSNVDYVKKYKSENKQILKEKSKQYYSENIDKISENSRQYYIDNIDKIKTRNKLYNEKNKDIINERRRNWHNKKMKDPIYKAKCAIRNLIISAIKRSFTQKSKRTMEILGCSYDEFREFIENKFTPEMNWENHGNYWEIDHIIPLSWAKDEEEVYKLNHFSNLQPLPKTINKIKSNKFSG